MSKSLRSLLQRVEQYFAGSTAVVELHRKWTYGEVLQRARRLGSELAASIHSTGDGKRPRVAILDQNSQAYLETYYACALEELTIVPLNFRLAPAELIAILNEVTPDVLIVGPAFEDVARKLDLTIRTIFPSDYERIVNRSDLASRPSESVERQLQLDEISAIYYTSGTTGEPKGVCLSELAMLTTVEDGLYSFAFQPTDVWLHAAPMFHLADVSALWPVTAVGAAHVFTKFDPSTFFKTVSECDVTTTSLPPTLINMIAAAGAPPVADKSPLRRISFGGSPMPEEVFRRAREVFTCELFQAYGVTETSGFVCAGLPGDGVDADKTVGRPVPSIDLRIFRDDGFEAATGELGEMAVKSVKVMSAYWGKPEATASVLRDGWYLTGDLGSVDEHGLFSVRGRKKDMIITGGENVYAAEVESCLTKHGAVYEAAVFGLPDAKWGELVHAVVSVRDGSQVSEDELRAWCREKIAGYKIPRNIEILSEPLPKSGPGKIAKHLLKRKSVEHGSI